MIDVLGFEPEDPAAYGRLILAPDGTLDRIVEYKDADEDERAAHRRDAVGELRELHEQREVHLLGVGGESVEDAA